MTTTTTPPEDVADATEHDSLKYHLLGPSLTKAGQDSVDQSRVSEIIYNASKGSKFFNREEVKDKILTEKIDQILEKKRRLDNLDLTRELRHVDNLITQLELSRDLSQHIVHVDCDAFYAAVEQLDRPELKDLPFAVGGGVLTTCNYVARKYGCRSGMAGFVAKKLCPELIFIKLNFDKYNAKAHEVRKVLVEYDPRFESASIDEAYLNITQYCLDHDITPEDAVQQMRREVFEQSKITVSAGIAANAKLAKICSNMNKPNGQYKLANDRVEIMKFMSQLPPRKVNGIGRVLERQLSAIGIKTCGEIYNYRQFIHPLFGDKAYEFLINCYLGLGRTRIQPAEEYERKSVGTESTFGDMSDPKQLREKLRWTADELEKDMKKAECKGRTLVLKIKLHTYEVYTRQVVTPKAIHVADDLYNYALPILSKLEQELPNMRLRLMGLRVTHLVSTKKPDTMAFFGFRPRKDDSSTTTGIPKQTAVMHRVKSNADEDCVKKDSTVDDEDDAGWEQWPEEALSQMDEELQMEADAIVEASRETEEAATSSRRHGKEIVPNPTRNDPEPKPEEEWWDCPICNRPQASDERQFNEHIDLCLSRQTIKDAVQEQESDLPREQPSSAAPSTKISLLSRAATPEGRSKPATEKKRGRPRAVDPRQKKLRFV